MSGSSGSRILVGTVTLGLFFGLAAALADPASGECTGTGAAFLGWLTGTASG